MSTGTPISVLKQAEEAEKIYQQSLAELEGATGATGATGPVEAEPTPEATGATGPAPEESELEKAQHKYDVLRGKYDKEIPELATRLGEALQKINELTAKLTDVTQIKKPDATPPPVVDIEKDPDVTFLKTEYPEVWKALSGYVTRVADAANAQIKTLTDRVEAQGHEITRSKKDVFYDSLDEVKDWKVINKSEEFDTWLNQTDDFTGYPRRALLTDAYEKLDPVRVKSFYIAFSKEFEKTQQSSTDQDVVTKKTVVEDVTPVPSKSKTEPVDKTQAKVKLIRGSEIQQFYQEQIKGKWKGREKEAEAREAEINKAIAEGRVVAG